MIKIKFLLMIFILVISTSEIFSEGYGDVTIGCQYYWNPLELVPVPENKPLQFYMDSAFLFSKDYSDHLADLRRRGQNPDSLIIQEVDTIGQILNKKVVDIFFNQFPENYNSKLGKIVLIETSPDLYKLLYIFISRPGIFYPEKSKIIKVDSVTILYTRSPYNGQWVFYSERYWVFNEKTNCFNTFELKSALEGTSKLLPDSCKMTKDYFHVDSLFWHSYAGKDGDHYRWPTCGHVKAWFKFDGCELILEKREYDPLDKAPH